VAESRGNFYFRDRLHWACGAQRVDALAASAGGGVTIRGGFDDGGSCGGVVWVLSLSSVATPAGARGAHHVGFELSLEGSAAHEPINRVQLISGLAPTNTAVWGLGVQYTPRLHTVPQLPLAAVPTDGVALCTLQVHAL
jgi:hypothetical protein